MGLSVTPAGGVSLAAPGYTLGTANTKGSATTVAPTDSTLLAFDATVPTTIASSAVAAAGSAAVAARRDHTHGAPALATAPVFNYKSATQVFTTNTTLANVSGAVAATFSFAIAANEVWRATYYIPLAFGGSGGVKFQITGPTAPTAVLITSQPILTVVDTTTVAVNPAQIVTGRVSVTAFATDIGALNSSASTGNTYPDNGSGGIFIEAVIINGANAGTVTLQAAQNSANSTTTLGVGSVMIAQKMN